MKIIIYAVLQTLIRLAPREVQIILLCAAAGIAAVYLATAFVRTIKGLHTKLKAYLELRRAHKKIAEIEERQASDARLQTPLDPYRYGRASTYQKELEQIVDPLNYEQRITLLQSKQLSAESKEAIRKYHANRAYNDRLEFCDGPPKRPTF